MRILFLPQYPDREFYSLTAIIHHLDYTATRSPNADFDFAMLWSDATVVDPPPDLARIAREKPVLNLKCTDISKRRVEERFRETFGYGSHVDPSTFHGPCIKKSDENALGTAWVIEGPAPREDGFVYQRMIPTEVDGVTVEYRTPVILGEIPLVNIWRRRPLHGELHERAWVSTTPTPTERVYSDAERRLILKFAEAMNLDFGELDVLRSREDGQLYILDVNTTPSGYGMLNRVNWKAEDKRKSLAILAECFDRRVRALLADSRGGGH